MYIKRLIIFLYFEILLFSCVKQQNYPYLVFTNDNGGVTYNQTLNQNQKFTVNIVATKNNQPLGNMVVSVLYNNDSLQRTIFNHRLTGDSTQRFATTYTLTTRNLPGIEKYTFLVASADGIITSKTLQITVVK